LKKLLTTVAFLALLPTGSIAEPTVGLGVSFKFGSKSVDPGLALRLFSDNRHNRMAGTIGLDFLFQTLAWRATVGAAYMGDDTFLGIDFGLGSGFGSGGINTGLSGGYVNTFGPAGPATTPPAQTPPVVTPPVVTPPVVTPPVVTPPVTPPVEKPPANSAFLEEDNMDLIIGGESDFA
jgi:hypothetical protein